MEASVATPTVPPEAEPSGDGEAKATQSTAELFEYSGFVHVGATAEDCEHAEDGACRERSHFHAWVCLPNTFQVRDIVDKARAAKARRVRALRDPESDSGAVLEAELEDIWRDHRQALIEALGRSAVERELGDIMRELGDDERFAHQQQDAEELRRLRELPDDERDPEEFARLEADVTAYAEQLQKIVDERQDREVERLSRLSHDEVLELERSARVDNISTEFYMHTYYTWSIFVGTRVPCPVDQGFPTQRKFKDPNDLKVAPPEVVVALREKLRELESRAMGSGGDARGN